MHVRSLPVAQALLFTAQAGFSRQKRHCSRTAAGRRRALALPLFIALVGADRIRQSPANYHGP
jgi:hypothetical protein